jgi:FKBP-type peptidyl-prolyl cis-trans isomerase 2
MPKRTLLVLTIALAAVLAACGSGEEEPEATGGLAAQDGDLVEVHYVGTLDDGTEFDSSRQPGREPLEFTVASGQVIPGFDDAVRGLMVGETRVHTMTPEDAYGEWTEDAVFEVPYGPSQSDVAVGDRVTLNNGFPAIVLEVNEETVLLDANHELAGESLTFEVEILSITRPEPTE